MTRNEPAVVAAARIAASAADHVVAGLVKLIAIAALLLV